MIRRLLKTGALEREVKMIGKILTGRTMEALSFYHKGMPYTPSPTQTHAISDPIRPDPLRAAGLTNAPPQSPPHQHPHPP